MFHRITGLGLSFVAWSLLGQSLSLVIAESVPIQSEYRCAGEWKPFDIAFSSDGTLYSTDFYSGSLYRHNPECRELTELKTPDADGQSVRGVAVDAEGRVCFSNVNYWIPSYVATRAQIRPRLYCWAGAPAANVIPDIESPWFHAVDTLGLAALDDLFFVTLFNGLRRSVNVVHEGEIIHDITLESWLGNFIHPLSEDEFFVTAISGAPPVRNRFEEVVSADDGAVVRLKDGVVSEFIGDLSYPTGILGTEERLFVADYLDGVIGVYSLDGELLHETAGFIGPMGLAWAPGGELCIAEMDAGRITCQPVDLFEPTH